MSEHSDSDLLGDIRQAILRIKAYTETADYDGFLVDTKTQDAVVRNLEIIGEAARGVSTALRQRHPDVPWREMAGVRDRLIHHYFGVNLDVVWDIISREIAKLEPAIEAMIEEDDDNR